jgi:hypothetical protein
VFDDSDRLPDARAAGGFAHIVPTLMETAWPTDECMPRALDALKYGYRRNDLRLGN